MLRASVKKTQKGAAAAAAALAAAGGGDGGDQSKTSSLLTLPSRRNLRRQLAAKVRNLKENEAAMSKFRANVEVSCARLHITVFCRQHLTLQTLILQTPCFKTPYCKHFALKQVIRARKHKQYRASHAFARKRQIVARNKDVEKHYPEVASCDRTERFDERRELAAAAASTRKFEDDERGDDIHSAIAGRFNVTSLLSIIIFRFYSL
jgi:hypothetical protein